MHGFAEIFHADLPAYSLIEITVEKLRALLQSRARLQERGWGASRVCRDYYDLWNLLRLPGIYLPALIPLIQQKCIIRNVSYQSPDDFVADDLFFVARKEWTQQLIPIVPNAPPVEQCLAEVRKMILSIWE
jgi:predicted nucleotidyltransferase component of viral defense system